MSNKLSDNTEKQDLVKKSVKFDIFTRDYASPDDVLNEIGDKNVYILYIYYMMSISWAITAMPMMVSAFLTDEEISNNRTNFTATHTITVEFDLIGDWSHLVSWVAASFMFGNMIGACTLTWLSDRFGRKIVMELGLFLMGLCGCLSYFSPNFETFLVMRFMQGASFSSGVISNWVLAYESIPKTLRSQAAKVFGYMWIVGYCIVAPFAMWLENWRWLMVSVSLPSLLFTILCYFTIPESFYFLIMKRKYEKLEEWIRKAENFGQVNFEIDVEKLCDAALTGSSQKKSTISISKITKFLCKNKILVIYTLVIAFLWSCDTFVYYGLSLLSTNLHGNKYINFVLSGLVEFPAYWLAPVLLNRFGRKAVVSSTHLITGLALLIAVFIAFEHSLAKLILWLIAKLFISCAFTSLFVYASELFPTSSRNSCIGIGEVFARVASAFAPFIKELELIWKPLPLLIFGVTSIIAGLLTLVLPETKNRNLPTNTKNVPVND